MVKQSQSCEISGTESVSNVWEVVVFTAPLKLMLKTYGKVRK
jgi:hypothetical protein